MAEGGFDNPVYGTNDPSLDDHDEDSDDGDQGPNETTHFWPGSASTPGPSGEEIPMQTMQQEKSGLPDTSYVETPSLEGFINQDDKPAMLERAKEFLNRSFQKWTSQNSIQQVLPKGTAMRQQLYHLVQKVVRLKFSKKDWSLLKNFTDKFKTSLGPEAKSLIAQDNEEIRETRQSLREAERQLKEAEKLSSEREKAAQKVQDLRTRLNKTQAWIDALHDEQGSTVESESELCRLQQLRKNLKKDFDNAKKEVAALQKTSKKHSERTNNR